MEVIEVSKLLLLNIAMECLNPLAKKVNNYFLNKPFLGSNSKITFALPPILTEFISTYVPLITTSILLGRSKDSPCSIMRVPG